MRRVGIDREQVRACAPRRTPASAAGRLAAARPAGIVQVSPDENPGGAPNAQAERVRANAGRTGRMRRAPANATPLHLRPQVRSMRGVERASHSRSVAHTPRLHATFMNARNVGSARSCRCRRRRLGHGAGTARHRRPSPVAPMSVGRDVRHRAVDTGGQARRRATAGPACRSPRSRPRAAPAASRHRVRR